MASDRELTPQTPDDVDDVDTDEPERDTAESERALRPAPASR